MNWKCTCTHSPVIWCCLQKGCLIHRTSWALSTDTATRGPATLLPPPHTLLFISLKRLPAYWPFSLLERFHLANTQVKQHFYSMRLGDLRCHLRLPLSCPLIVRKIRNVRAKKMHVAALFQCQYNAFLCLQLAGIADHTWLICRGTVPDLNVCYVSTGRTFSRTDLL